MLLKRQTKIDVKSIIEKITDLTTKGELNWSYIDIDDRVLAATNKMLKQQQERDIIIINPCFVNIDKSFFCDINNGYLVLIQSERKFQDPKGTVLPTLYLATIPAIGGRDNRILHDGDKFQDVLFQLQIIIQRDYPNAEDFLESVMGL